jgi:hypothetical protein
MPATASPTGYNPTQNFSYNGGAYGSPVQSIPLPNPSAALNSVLPGTPGNNNQLSGLISSELSGNISPDVMNELQDKSASFGVGTGLGNAPGNTLNLQNLLTGMGINSESQQAKGVSDYNSVIPTVAKTQTLDPSLAYEANSQNAIDAAAPNPTAAANEEQQLLQQYMQELNPAGGNNGSFDANVRRRNNTVPGGTVFGAQLPGGGVINEPPD